MSGVCFIDPEKEYCLNCGAEPADCGCGGWVDCLHCSSGDGGPFLGDNETDGLGRCLFCKGTGEVWVDHFESSLDDGEGEN